VPLVRFTGSKRKMGPFANRAWLSVLAWAVTVVIVVLNGQLIYQQIGEWMTAAGSWGWLIAAVCLPFALGLGALLVWMTFRREVITTEGAELSAEKIAKAASNVERRFARIGVALDALPTDTPMLAEAVALAKTHKADLLLMHIVDGVGGTWYGDQTGDQESRSDERYLEELAERLREELRAEHVGKIEIALGYGDASTEIVNIAKRHNIELMVLGGHGHRGFWDLLHGYTISGVRHGLEIPIVAVRGKGRA
jgi:manganese transport protein